MITDPTEIQLIQTKIKLSLELIKSAFDDTTIIEYFLKINHKYKSYNNVLYYFNGTYWIKGSNQNIINEIDSIYRCLYQLARQTYQYEELIKILKKIICLRSINYKLTLIKGITGYIKVENDLWDLNDDLIGFKNGVYDLRKNVFRAGQYEDYISIVNDYEYSKSSEIQLKSVESYMEESDEFMNWFNSEYEHTTSKVDILKLADVFQNYCISDFYVNLPKKERRANNKNKFIEKVSTNISLRIFYKEKYQPYINGKQLCLRSCLTNYQVRRDE